VTGCLQIQKLEKLEAAKILKDAITGECQVTCYFLTMNMHATAKKIVEGTVALTLLQQSI
jgi:hypothetical protein